MDEKRFEQLCAVLKKTLNDLFLEFPNCNIYLFKGIDEKVNIMDLVVPWDFSTFCEIGEY